MRNIGDDLICVSHDDAKKLFNKLLCLCHHACFNKIRATIEKTILVANITSFRKERRCQLYGKINAILALSASCSLCHRLHMAFISPSYFHTFYYSRWNELYSCLNELRRWWWKNFLSFRKYSSLSFKELTRYSAFIKPLFSDKIWNNCSDE